MIFYCSSAVSWDEPAAKDTFALDTPVEAEKTYYLSMRKKNVYDHRNISGGDHE